MVSYYIGSIYRKWAPDKQFIKVNESRNSRVHLDTIHQKWAICHKIRSTWQCIIRSYWVTRRRIRTVIKSDCKIRSSHIILDSEFNLDWRWYITCISIVNYLTVIYCPWRISYTCHTTICLIKTFKIVIDRVSFKTTAIEAVLYI